MSPASLLNRSTRWWWIRHAPVAGQEGRYYGRLDVAADFTGQDESLSRLGRSLANGFAGKVAVWTVSPLRRTVETLAAVMAAVGEGEAEPLVVPELIEQDFGTWQGQSYAAVGAEVAPEEWQRPGSIRPPAGESFADVIARIGPAIDALSRRHEGREIVAVAHAGTIRAAIAHALGLEADQALRFVLDPLSLTRLVAHPTDDGAFAWAVDCVNRSGE